jgi:peroxiredoxin
MRRSYFVRAVVELTVAFGLLAGAAQVNAMTPNVEKIQIRTTSESPTWFDLASQSGKTVLVFHWSTTCPVCLDKFNELRSNLVGWRTKPFVVLMINHDRSRQDFLEYVRVTRTINGDSPQLMHVYHKDMAQDSLYKGSALPTSYVIDEKQVLRHTYLGRIPSDAWNDIADLLP